MLPNYPAADLVEMVFKFRQRKENDTVHVNFLHKTLSLANSLLFCRECQTIIYSTNMYNAKQHDCNVNQSPLFCEFLLLNYCSEPSCQYFV